MQGPHRRRVMLHALPVIVVFVVCDEAASCPVLEHVGWQLRDRVQRRFAERQQRNVVRLQLRRHIDTGDGDALLQSRRDRLAILRNGEIKEIVGIDITDGDHAVDIALNVRHRKGDHAFDILIRGVLEDVIDLHLGRRK